MEEKKWIFHYEIDKVLSEKSREDLVRAYLESDLEHIRGLDGKR